MMAKRKANATQPKFPALNPARQTAEGFYAGGRPNPDLRRFVAENARRYDPGNDDYSLRGFNEPLEMTIAIHRSQPEGCSLPVDEADQLVAEAEEAQTKVEKGDIENVVGEFRTFLETALNGDARAESTIVEIR